MGSQMGPSGMDVLSQPVPIIDQPGDKEMIENPVPNDDPLSGFF